MMNLQQRIQWFGYDVIITCEVVTRNKLHTCIVVTRDKLHELEQEREEPNPSPSLNVTEKTLKLRLPLYNKLNNR